jgi:tetratricopeptide (TPR) repeat protein
MATRREKKPLSRIGKGSAKRKGKKLARTDASRPQKAGPKARPITGWRLWLFRFAAAVVLPALLVGIVELVLRVSRYGYPARAITTFKTDGTLYGCDNAQFSWRFFPRHLAREAVPYVFPAVKPDGTCRIFVLGASAAMGVPEPTFSFGRMLRVMLADRYRGVRFEVITTAMAAINSHVVLPIAKDAARYDPDVFVVYLGNNEVTGPYGAGTVFAPLSGNLGVIRAAIAFKGTRLGQLMTNVLGAPARGDDTPQMWRGLEMFKNRQIRADDAGLQTVYRHFQDNLQDIVRTGRRSGAEVVLCTVGSNLKDNPPFGSLHRPDLSDSEEQAWDGIYARGIEHEQAGRYAEAVQEYLATAEIDDSYADLQFRLGRCYGAPGQYDSAADRYVQARELDTLRFRADNRINEIIRDVARQAGAGVVLADTVRTLAENSPEHTVGDALFYEHVHLNFTGNYLLARLVLDRVEEALPERVRQMRAEEGESLSETECAQRLAYTPWDRHKIANKVLNDFIKRPPFSDRLYHEALVTRLEQSLALLKAQVTRPAREQAVEWHRQAVARSSDDWMLHWKYGQLLSEALRAYRPAAEQFRWVRDHLPHSWLGYDSLATALYALGDLDGAIAQYTKAVELQPTCGRAHFFLGEASQKKGDIDKATKHYVEAMRWEPNCLPAYSNMARILAQKGELDKAVEICRRGLVFCPDSATLHGNLGTLLARQGQRTEAIVELRAALAIDPNSTPVAESLNLLQKAGR